MTGPAERDLAAAIVEAADDPDQRAVLDRGEVPPPVATAAASFAASRSSGQRWIGLMTDVLRAWSDAGARLQVALGRAPNVTELAAEAGKSRTAAQAAIRRLRRMKLWPPTPAEGRDETPHPERQSDPVEV